MQPKPCNQASPRHGRGLIIYDFDGVIADSEVIANAVLAEMVTELGRPTTLADCYRLYMGKRFVDVVAAIEASLGSSLPEGFAASYQARTLVHLQRDLRTVAGARQHILAFSRTPKCIASSSSPDRLAVCLEVLGLQAEFDDRVYSAASVARGKPYPDIFLHAAAHMGVRPAHCLVIEDSASGVEAARAAGMAVIAVLAASHIQADHQQRLLQAGAQRVALTFAQAEKFTREFLVTLGDQGE